MIDSTLYAGVSQDSRQVSEGDLFVAIPCAKVSQHVQEAIQKGAVAVVSTRDVCQALQPLLFQVKTIEVPNPRQVLSQLASDFYPLQPDVNVAVTGTNGKSSTVHFVQQLWAALSLPAARFGTLGVQAGGGLFLPEGLTHSALTTPDAVSLHRLLNALARQGVSHCAFEASSHGLDQYRLHGVRLKAAAFTNFSQDHLDYHSSLSDYFQAKSRLFLEILPIKHAVVLHAGLDRGTDLKRLCQNRKQPIIQYGIEMPEADIRAEQVQYHPAGMTFTLCAEGHRWTQLDLHMVGAFQLENLLCALGLIQATGIPIGSLVEHISTLRPVPGRLDYVGQTASGGVVFVDFGHTPDALQRALRDLRAHTLGNIHVVFGCGGGRDAGKRPMMGQVAEANADRVYVTDDNPRHEDPSLIRQHILEGCTTAIEVTKGRRQAILDALSGLKKGDVLLVAGKGHEEAQSIDGKTIPFNDRKEIEKNIKV